MSSVFLFFIRLLALLPFSVLYFFSNILFVIIYYIMGYRRKVVLTNLSNSFPEKSEKELKQIEKSFYRHLCDLIAESIKSERMTQKQFMARYKLLNIDLLFEYGKKNRSLILLSSHQGNWEWVCYLPSLLTDFYKVYAVYQPANNKVFDTYIKNTRERHTASLISMKQTFEVVRKTFKEKQTSITWMAADQTPSKEAGHWLTFLHQDTPFFAGYDKLANETNYAVLFLGVKKIKRGYYELVLTPISENPQEEPPYKIVEKFAELTEAQILQQPAYWLWSHKRWKHQRDKP